MKIQEKPDYLVFADSAKNGECTNFPDVSRGWGVTIDQTASKPPMEWMNGAFNRVDKNMLYLLQQGIPEWCEYVKYPVNAIIKYKGVLYTAIVENDNAIPTSDKWEKTIAEVPTASTTQKGVVKLSSATNSLSETEASTSLAVKKAYDLANEAVKKSGDTMTGQLILSEFGIKHRYTDSENLMVLRTIGDNYSCMFYDAEKKQWQSKLVYSSSTNSWNFPSIDDVKINNKSLLNNYIPIGVPMPWPQTTPPEGWLECNGSTFDKNKFPKLAVAYPAGKLPDLRGEFIRGWDNGKGTDSNRGVLSWQNDAIRNIYGEISPISETFGAAHVATGAFQYFEKHSDHTPTSIDRGLAGGVTFDASRIVPTANENRPRNVAFMYIVKAE